MPGCSHFSLTAKDKATHTAARVRVRLYGTERKKHGRDFCPSAFAALVEVPGVLQGGSTEFQHLSLTVEWPVALSSSGVWTSLSSVSRRT